MQRENPLTEWKYASQLAFLDELTDEKCIDDDDDYDDDDDAGKMDKIKLKVIDEVRKHPMLYNPKLPEFKSVCRRNLEWNRVSQAINVDGRK